MLPLSLSEKVQRQFVEKFCPEQLPRLSTPYWGRIFSKAEQLHSAQLVPDCLGSAKSVLCLSGRPFARPISKHLRPVYLCPRTAVVPFLKSIHWSLGCDLYVFDKTMTWFIAAVEERIFQMSDDGDYVLLKGHSG